MFGAVVLAIAIQAAPAPEVPDNTVILRRDTPLELMATTEITTATAKPGTVFKLRVNRPVVVNGITVVPVGAWVFGQVVTATTSGSVGRSGTMQTRLDYLQLGTSRIKVEGEATAKGTGAGSAGAVIVLSGLIGVFHRGNNAKIKAGELVSGFIAEDATIDLSGGEPRRVDAPAAS